MSRKFSVCGPTRMGTPKYAGSSTLCPPSRDETASDESEVSKFVKASQLTDGIEQQHGADDGALAVHSERNSQRKPDDATKRHSRKASGCRGASTISAPG